MSTTIEEFHAPIYAEHTAARLAHLRTLGLLKAGETVLEVGAGPGDFTKYLLSVGCTVTATDARQDVVDAIKSNAPNAKAALLDLDVPNKFPGTFDWVFCYGALYHLEHPKEALCFLRSKADRILLETCVSLGATAAVNFVDELETAFSQSVHGHGCRPTRPWVFNALAELWGHAYITITQPVHPQFPLNWKKPVKRHLYRAIFAASAQPIDNPVLADHLLDAQGACNG